VSSTNLARQFLTLHQIVSQHADWWQPNPFYLSHLPWEHAHPDIAQFLRQLDDSTLAAMEHAHWPTKMPQMLRDLCNTITQATHLAPLPAQTWSMPAIHGVQWHIPGRKWAQIHAFAAHIPPSPDISILVDWCAGKGHLGRMLSLSQQRPCECIEINATLCEEGAALARQTGAALTFTCDDALRVQSLPPHALVCALHACGPLHVKLIDLAMQGQHLSGLALAPCCYNRAHAYRPLSCAARKLPFQLDEEAAKLCLRETVTSAPRLAQRRERETAWRLGFDQLQRELSGLDRYRPIASVPTAWLTADFAHFARQLSARLPLALPASLALHTYEAHGWQRLRDVRRLGWLRNQFRRAIELLIVHDRALCLEEVGYTVALGTFCEHTLTPRNLMIYAQRLQ
jgi:hypothetical protein